MTAPTRGGNEGERKSGRQRQRTEQRGNNRTNRRGRVRSATAERAYERKRERGKQPEPRQSDERDSERRGRRHGENRREKESSRPGLSGSGILHSGAGAFYRLLSKVATSRAAFVGTAMVVLAAGIVTTLWLSIAAVSNSYRIQDSKERVQALTERKEDLMRSVSKMGSISEIQQRVEEMNMVPAPDPAHLVVAPDGSVRVVGEPSAAPMPDPPSSGPPSEGTSSEDRRPDDVRNEPGREANSEDAADSGRSSSNDPSME
ncbi:hypothetical protein FHR84_001340 [Actinopolyspora biskrensis]|uniref:Cell division protein FtsL n=1 Tax=Actinopolyspora biskrensis TaxID=1470178 RepID=A0A852YVF9_9ACTN|nr:hypothetical protein [Actinopolyspora biskrensis]NYH78018.1 hypothetical protein [Actinopolyspora biskrensis]